LSRRYLRYLPENKSPINPDGLVKSSSAALRFNFVVAAPLQLFFSARLVPPAAGELFTKPSFGQKTGFSFIPAKAGIYLFQGVLDPGFRRGDGPKDFLRDYQPLINWKKKYLNEK
jgi:hypothetical protein